MIAGFIKYKPYDPRVIVKKFQLSKYTAMKLKAKDWLRELARGGQREPGGGNHAT